MLFSTGLENNLGVRYSVLNFPLFSSRKLPRRPPSEWERQENAKTEDNLLESATSTAQQTLPTHPVSFAARTS